MTAPSRVAVAALRLVSEGRDPLTPVFRDPNTRLRPLQERAAEALLEKVGLDFTPHRLSELLGHVDAVRAVQAFMRLLRLDLNDLLQNDARRAEAHAAFTVLRQAEGFLGESSLDDCALYEALATNQPALARNALENLHRATVLERELASLPEAFASHYASTVDGVRRAIPDWNQLNAEKFHNWTAILAAWRSEARNHDALGELLATRWQAAAPYYSEVTRAELEALEHRVSVAQTLNGSPLQVLAELRSVEHALASFVANQQSTAPPLSSNPEEPETSPRARSAVRDVSVPLRASVALLAAAILLAIVAGLARWSSHLPAPMRLHDPTVPADEASPGGSGEHR